MREDHIIIKDYHCPECGKLLATVYVSNYDGNLAFSSGKDFVDIDKPCKQCAKKIKENKNEQKLKPCPICGSNKVVKTIQHGWGVSTKDRSRIECKSCGLKTRIFYSYEKEKVEDYWNGRKTK